MKTKLILTALSISVLSAMAAPTKEEALPKQQTFARYEVMANKSPFAVASAPINAPPPPNVFKDLYISNAARLTDESVVTLTSSTDKNLKEYLSTKTTNEHGYTISNIEWSDRIGATKVTISKDGQFGTLTFNQALVTQSIATVPPQPVITAPMPLTTTPGSTVPPVPQYNNPAAGGIKPAPIPTLPTPPPRVRGVIQRNPGAVQQIDPVKTEEN